MQTFFKRPDNLDNENLHVVTTIFNPVRYRSRWKLYQDFVHRCLRPGVELYTVEIAFGEREFALEEHPQHLRLRTNSEIWLKENALNLLAQRLPADWQYMAWIDADVSFARDDWADETKHRLQHYKLVQMWSEAHDLDSKHNILQSFKSMGWCYHNNVPHPEGDSQYYYFPQGKGRKTAFWHPGFAWAIRREAYQHLGGLIDWSILGNADTLMGRCVLDMPIGTPAEALGKSGQRALNIWKERAKGLQKNLGYVDGALLHYWHGPKANRQYNTRNKILIGHGFEPDLDLKRDWQGLWQLTDRNPALHEKIRGYFSARNEDAP